MGGPAADHPGGADPIPGKLEWVLRTRERLQAMSPHSQIYRVGAITPEAFLHRHYAANWPAILIGEMADWPALTRWTPDYLRGAVGGAMVEVQTGRSLDADFERNMESHRTVMPFDAFIDRITAPGAGNDTYMTASNAGRNAQALAPLQADLGRVDKVLDYASPDARGMLWIGPAGSFTPLHHDLTNNLLLQIVGRKRVILVSPGQTPSMYNDYHVYSRVRDIAAPGAAAQFPALNGVIAHDVLLHPGDALFIPVGWWHQVRALDFSVSATHINFRWPNEFYREHPT